MIQVASAQCSMVTDKGRTEPPTTRRARAARATARAGARSPPASLPPPSPSLCPPLRTPRPPAHRGPVRPGRVRRGERGDERQSGWGVREWAGGARADRPSALSSGSNSHSVASRRAQIAAKQPHSAERTGCARFFRATHSRPSPFTPLLPTFLGFPTAPPLRIAHHPRPSPLPLQPRSVHSTMAFQVR